MVQQTTSPVPSFTTTERPRRSRRGVVNIIVVLIVSVAAMVGMSSSASAGAYASPVPAQPPVFEVPRVLMVRVFVSMEESTGVKAVATMPI